MATVYLYYPGDFRQLDIYSWQYLVPTNASSTYFSGYYSFDPLDSASFIGSGFAYSNGVPYSGTVNRFFETYAGGLVYDVQNVSIPVSTLLYYSQTGNTAAAVVTVLAGNDSISGSAYDDVVLGLAGNDTINGGGGTDTVAYVGLRSDYSIVRGNGQFIVTDLNVTDGNEGTDTLYNVEFLSFSNVTMSTDVLPFVSASSLTVARGATLAASSLFTYVDGDSDPAVSYEFWDGTADATSGYFTVNGTIQAARQSIPVSAAQLGQVEFHAVSGSDTLWVRANDSYGWSNWVSFTVTAPVNNAPVTVADNQMVGRNANVAASTLFTVSDADGDTITAYQFWDSTAGSSSGHFVVNGVAQASNVAIDVSAAQLANTSFQAAAGTDHLWVRAFDGLSWGAWDPFDVTAPANTLPVLAVSNKTPAHGATSLTGASLVNYSDGDGDPAARFQFWDSGVDPNSGYFTVGGTPQGTNVAIDVAAAALGTVSFHLGSVGDLLWVRASDGIGWGEWKSFTVAAPANAIPVAIAPDTVATHGETLNAGSLFTYSDADGDAPVAYRFWDSTPGGGRFVVNGIDQAANVAINVDAADLGVTTFATGSGADQLWVSAFDGYAWSAWDAFTVTAPINAAPVLFVSDKTPGHTVSSLTAASLFNYTDGDGDVATRYQFWDSGTANDSGYFTVSGVRQATNSAIDVLPANLANVSFQLGTSGDLVWVRASDGIDWSAWKSFTIAAPTNIAPVIVAPDLVAVHGESIAATALFSYDDEDNDPAVRYQFWDSTPGASSGHFSINGVAQAAGQAIDIAAADLSDTTFDVGSGTDHLWVRAFDGFDWSAWNAFDVVAPVNGLPTVVAENLAVAANTTMSFPALFSGTDPDGDALSFRIWDATASPTSGHFELSGVQQPTNVAIDVSADDIANGTYVAGTTGDVLWFQAFDGLNYGAWLKIEITVV